MSYAFYAVLVLSPGYVGIQIECRLFGLDVGSVALNLRLNRVLRQGRLSSWIYSSSREESFMFSLLLECNIDAVIQTRI